MQPGMAASKCDFARQATEGTNKPDKEALLNSPRRNFTFPGQVADPWSLSAVRGMLSCAKTTI
jgi:hypothetical protein